MTTATKTPPTNGVAIKRSVDSNVFKTNDYKVFKRITGNRLVDTGHVNRLKESMKSHDLMIPIVCNENMEVVDGQHRLQARQELGIPVFYIVINGLSIQDTQKANANNKNWASRDFLNFYVEQNYYNYKVFRDFMKRFQFDIQVSIGLLSGQGLKSQDFNNGELVITHLEGAIEMAERICEVEPYYKGFKRRSFVFAIKRCFENEKFDFGEFLNKLSYQSSKLVHCATVDQYLSIIEDIYNYKRKLEDKIRFK